MKSDYYFSSYCHEGECLEQSELVEGTPLLTLEQLGYQYNERRAIFERSFNVEF